MTSSRTLQKEAKSESTSARRLAELAGESTELARLVARNPKTPAKLLKQLGSHSDATVRKWVTAHPGTPPEVLIRLASQFPEQWLTNPILDLMLLENMALLDELPTATRRSLVKRESCPVSFLEWLAKDEDQGVQLGLAMNPNTPRTIISKLRRSSDPAVATAASAHVNARKRRRQVAADPWDDLKISLEKTQLGSRALSRAERLMPWLVAVGPVTSQPARLLHDWVRYYVTLCPFARNPATPVPELEQMAKGAELEARKLVAFNPSTPPDLRAHLWKTEFGPFEIENMVVSGRAFTQELEILAGHPSAMIRQVVAEARATPQLAFEQLSRDRIARVREAVAANRSAPAKALERLSKDNVRRIRVAVASNPSAPPGVLTALASTGTPLAKRRVAAHKHTPAPALVALSESRNVEVLSELAAREDLPEPIQRRLASSNHTRVLTTLLQNPNVTARVLDELACLRKATVLRGVAAHPNATADTLELLAGTRNDFVKRAVALNPWTPTKVLRLLASHRWAYVRLGVCENPSTPLETLQELSKDKNEAVSRAATAALGEERCRPRRRARRSGPTQAQTESLRQEETQVAPNGVGEVQRLGHIRHVNPDYGRLADWQHLSELAPDDLAAVEMLSEIPGSERGNVRRRLSEEFVEAHGKSTQPCLKRLMCLLLPDCPTPVLAKSSRSTDWKERLAIACHPKTPPAIRQRLANDGNEFVRAAAQQAMGEEG